MARNRAFLGRVLVILTIVTPRTHIKKALGSISLSSVFYGVLLVE